MTKRHLLIGVDEAGYGPNLGPFVSCLTAFETPAHLDHDLWKTLEQGIRRAQGSRDHRAVVDDSKIVHKSGSAQLERNVLAWTAPDLPICSQAFINKLALPNFGIKCSQAPWHLHIPAHLPIAADPNQIRATRDLVASTLKEQTISLCAMKLVVCEPLQFNTIVNAAGNKGAILAQSFTELLCSIDLHSYDNVTIVVDRHGGRRFYSDLLHTTFPAYRIVDKQEEGYESIYTLDGPQHQKLTISFSVGGDQKSLPVALASMTAKYTREVIMTGFNAYFSAALPGIKPTAGYPLDAKRFYAETAPILPRLGLPYENFWRAR